MIMDRLPLVQALTAAGLQRDGAEQVATALGEAIEATVATKGDLAREGARSDATISRLELATKAEFSRLELVMQTMETRLTLRLGGIIVTAMGLLFALLRFTGHTS